MRGPDPALISLSPATKLGGVLSPALLTIQMRIVLLCPKLHVFGSNGENILEGLICNGDISRSMWECSNKNAHFPSFKICVQIGAVGSEQISLQCNQQSAYTINTMQCIGWWWEQDSQDNVISALTSEYRGLIALNTHNSHQAATSTPTPATQVNLWSRRPRVKKIV